MWWRSSGKKLADMVFDTWHSQNVMSTRQLHQPQWRIVQLKPWNLSRSSGYRHCRDPCGTTKRWDVGKVSQGDFHCIRRSLSRTGQLFFDRIRRWQKRLWTEQHLGLSLMVVNAFFLGVSLAKRKKHWMRVPFSPESFLENHDMLSTFHTFSLFLGGIWLQRIGFFMVFQLICPVEESLLAGARFPGVATGSRWKIDVVAGRMWMWNTMGWWRIGGISPNLMGLLRGVTPPSIDVFYLEYEYTPACSHLDFRKKLNLPPKNIFWQIVQDDYVMKVEEKTGEDDIQRKEMCLLQKQLQCLKHRLRRGGSDEVMNHYRQGASFRCGFTKNQRC